MANITLTRLNENDREQFIFNNQCAFRYGTMEAKILAEWSASKSR